MKNQEIKDILGQKRAYKSSSFLLYISPRVDYKNRNVAILVSKKKFKTAVLRNKVKRLIKASLQDLNKYKDFIRNHVLIFNVTNEHILKSNKEDLVKEVSEVLVKYA